MQKQLLTWQLINNSLQQHIPVMLLYVVQSDGSSPGRAGFAMAVNAAGGMEGSIGGGIMEHKFVEMVKEQLLQQTAVTAVRKQVHNKQVAKDQSGMICSGEQTILLYPVKERDATAVQRLISCLQQHAYGTLQLSPAGLYFEEGAMPGTAHHFEMDTAGDWIYRGQTGYRHHLYIIGGGHCALALSELMSKLDFYIHVYDDREGLHTLLQNGFAHEQVTVSDYAELEQRIPSGNLHYVVVMTVGYRTDDIAIRALINKSFRYFGILGSKTKIEKMLDEYIAAGFPQKQLSKLYAPVGLSINSHSPEEIAISIAAEIIQLRNQPS
jgi:xanthine dehydrogenase accessory factor